MALHPCGRGTRDQIEFLGKAWVSSFMVAFQFGPLRAAWTVEALGLKIQFLALVIIVCGGGVGHCCLTEDGEEEIGEWECDGRANDD